MDIAISSPKKFHDTLLDELKCSLDSENSIALFLSGGSNLHLEAKLIQALSVHPNFTNLNLLPVDERFGPAGHADSNIANLQKLLSPKIKLHDILEQGTLSGATRELSRLTEKHLNPSIKTFAILGIGNDGHTAGILPSSPAESSQDFVTSYESNPFTRITLTQNALKKIDKIYVSAFGPEKASILQKLIDNPSTGLPMDFFHTHENVIVFTDNALKKGEQNQ